MGMGRSGTTARGLARQQDRWYVQAHQRGSLSAAFDSTPLRRVALRAAFAARPDEAPDHRGVLRRLEPRLEGRRGVARRHPRHPPSFGHGHRQLGHSGEGGHDAHRAQDGGDVHALCPHRGWPRAASRRTGGESARQRAASAVNSELSMLYWHIGQCIHTQVLDGRRADYGEETLPILAVQLVKDYGNSFSEKHLRRMVQFAVTFSDERIVVSLIRQLSWTHFIALIPLKDPQQRDYYAQMASVERWSVRTLRERIGSMLYERTALSQQPDALITQELATLRDAQRMSPSLIMRDPYILDFLGLRDTWQENDLEAAIIREMESFLLELGAGFTFVARQKRIQLDGEDFHLDLLFYNR